MLDLAVSGVKVLRSISYDQAGRSKDGGSSFKRNRLPHRREREILK